MSLETNYEDVPDFVYVDESDGSIGTVTSNKSNKRKSKGQRRSKKGAQINEDTKSRYCLANHLKEDHNEPLYNVQIHRPFEIDPKSIVFATVGSNRCSIYEYEPATKSLELIDAYQDADAAEIHYTCAWTTDPVTDDPIISVSGVKGIIRTIVPFKSMYKPALIGHGGSINDLKFHPSKWSILLSSSRDHTLRLWNIDTGVCIAIFGGVEGHRDEVLSGDFNFNATLLMSSSIDHSLKMWNINTPKIIKAIEDSETFTTVTKSFPTVLMNFPEYSTRDVHTNYVDYVRWLGDLVLSKSCENCVVCWKPGLFQESLQTITRNNKNVSILHTFKLVDCDIWYVRFGLDFGQKNLAVGTQNGKVNIWNIDTEDPKDIKKTIVQHTVKSKAPIRSVALSMNAQVLIAVNDEGQVLIWRKDY